MFAVLEIWLKTHFLLKRLEASQVCNYKKTVFNIAKHFFRHVFIPPTGCSFFGVFLLFLAKFTLQSSFFSESRTFTRPLFCFFVPDLDWLAGQPIQIFFAIQIFVLFCSIKSSRLDLASSYLESHDVVTGYNPAT